MIDILCFRGRVGRLRFFLINLAGGLVLGLLAVVLVMLFMPHFQRGETPSITAFVMPLVIILPLSLWFLFSLQAARFRDIGWNPLYVVPGWLLFTAIDAYIAFKIPEWSVGRQYHTVVGIVVNTGISIILMFMPGTSGDDTPSFSPQYRMPQSPSPNVGSMRNTVAVSRPTPDTRTSFGRRGL